MGTLYCEIIFNSKVNTFTVCEWPIKENFAHGRRVGDTNPLHQVTNLSKDYKFYFNQTYKRFNLNLQYAM